MMTAPFVNSPKKGAVTKPLFTDLAMKLVPIIKIINLRLKPVAGESNYSK